LSVTREKLKTNEYIFILLTWQNILVFCSDEEFDHARSCYQLYEGCGTETSRPTIAQGNCFVQYGALFV
jgi:hypothetical protein